MGKASLTIAISGSYNGKAIEKAEAALRNMSVTAASTAGGVAGSLANAGAAAAEMGGKIYNAGAKMESVGTAATKYVTVPIAAAAAACGKAAVDIDTSLANVRKTVDGTEEQYQALKDAAIEFSETNAVSASQILDIQALGAQLGFTLDELQMFGEVVSGLDIATNMDAEQAGTELAQFANITKMAHSEASNYASALVGLGNTSATTESDISSMAMRIAAAGTQVGMSQADILGLSAALASMGVEAEAGGTAISTIMSQIDKDIATNSENLETWAATSGMSAQDFAAAWKSDPVSALGALLSNMEKATAEGGNMSVMLEGLGIQEIRQTDIMKRLAGNSDLVAKSVATANEEWRANTALQNEVDNRNQSMAARFEMLQNKVTAVAESVGTPLVNAALEFVDAAQPVIDVVAGAAEAFADMDEEDQRMVVGLVAAAAACGPVVTVLGKVTKSVGNLVLGVGRGMQSLSTFAKGADGAASAASRFEAGAKTGATAAEGLGKAAGSASSGTGLLAKGVNLLNGALKASTIGLGVVLIGELVGTFQRMAEHEQLVTEVTMGMTDAMSAAQAAYEGYTPAIDTATEALGNNAVSAEDCLKSQANLAQTMTDTWSDIGTNAAQVDYYAGVIEELGNKGNLTAAEQAKLKDAIDNFNEITGNSISITNSQTGELDTQAASVRNLASAYIEEAKAQAARELYAETTKQLLQDQIAFEEATRKLNEAEQGFGIWLGDFPLIADPASVAYHDLQQDVNDLQSSMDSCSTTQEAYLEMMAGSAPAFATFDTALGASAAQMEGFSEVCSAELAGLESTFDGSLTSIVNACATQGVAIPTGLADAITSNSSLPQGAQQMMLDAMVLQILGGDVETAAKVLGHDIDQGLKDGITGSADLPQEAIGLLSEDTISKAKEHWESHSPSQVMYRLGSDIDTGLSNGISENSSQPQTAMGTLASIMQSAISGLPGFSESAGSSAGSGLASAIGSFAGSVSSSARSLYGSATGGISGTAEAFAGTGSGAASRFSSAIGIASAYGSGRSLATTANSGLGSVSAYDAGSNFSGTFARGMGGVDIWEAAYNVGMSALGAIKSALGIASPSREAMAVGKFFGEGAVIGMKSTERDLEAEAARMGEAMSIATVAPNPAAIGPRPAPQAVNAPAAGYWQGGADVAYSDVSSKLDRLIELLESLDGGMTRKVAAAMPSSIKVNETEIFRLGRKVGL